MAETSAQRYAFRKLVRSPDTGRLIIAFIDYETGEIVTDLEGYTILEAGQTPGDLPQADIQSDTPSDQTDANSSYRDVTQAEGGSSAFDNYSNNFGETSDQERNFIADILSGVPFLDSIADRIRPSTQPAPGVAANLPENYGLTPNFGAASVGQPSNQSTPVGPPAVGRITEIDPLTGRAADWSVPGGGISRELTETVPPDLADRNAPTSVSRSSLPNQTDLESRATRQGLIADFADMTDPISYGRQATRNAQPFAGAVVHHAEPTTLGALREVTNNPRENGAYLGYSIAVDPSGRTAQLAPLGVRTNHIGAVPSSIPGLTNANSLGIAITDAYGPITDESIAAAAEAIAAVNRTGSYGFIDPDSIGYHGKGATDTRPVEGKEEAQRIREYLGGLPFGPNNTPTPTMTREQALASMPSNVTTVSVSPRDEDSTGARVAREITQSVREDRSLTPAEAASMGFVDRTPEERSAMAVALAGELAPDTLAGLAARDPNAIAEAMNVMGVIENRAAARNTGVQAQLDPSQVHAFMDKNLDVTRSNYAQYRETVEDVVDNFYAGNLGRPSVPGATHYANMDISNPSWADYAENGQTVGQHTFFEGVSVRDRSRTEYDLPSISLEDIGFGSNPSRNYGLEPNFGGIDLTNTFGPSANRDMSTASQYESYGRGGGGVTSGFGSTSSDAGAGRGSSSGSPSTGGYTPSSTSSSSNSGSPGSSRGGVTDSSIGGFASSSTSSAGAGRGSSRGSPSTGGYSPSSSSKSSGSSSKGNTSYGNPSSNYGASPSFGGSTASSSKSSSSKSSSSNSSSGGFGGWDGW